MKLTWKKITSLPHTALEKDTEEVEVMLQPVFGRLKDKKEKKQKYSHRKKNTGEVPEGWLPEPDQERLAVDMYYDEEKNVFVLQSTIAGVSHEALDITVEPDLIIIRGKRESEKTKNHHLYYYQECFWDNFSRTLVLPEPIIPDKVKATLKNGILTVIMQLADKKKDNESVKIE